MPYAELHAKTNFSFLEGASHPDELIASAAELGYEALAITDRNSLAGVVRAHVAAKEVGLKLLVGAEIVPDDAPPVVLWATDRASYGRLAALITRGRRRAEKGECFLTLQDVAEYAEGLLAGVIPIFNAAPIVAGVLTESSKRPKVSQHGGNLQSCVSAGSKDLHRSERWDRQSIAPQTRRLQEYRAIFDDRCYLLAELHRGPDDQRRLSLLEDLARRSRIPLVAAGDVFFHVPERRALHDVLTAVRHGMTVAEATEHLFSNAERHLKSVEQITATFSRVPDAVHRTLEVARRVSFSLDELRYEYPEELAPKGETPLQYLTRLTWAGARKRYPGGVPQKVRKLLEHELELIEELHYEAYFLTVWDLVRFARSRGILCQGRGSAANSAVCYCLGVTAVDPERMDLLFERFVSRERNEAPDIDVDFEHERREEVLQYLYEKYGRDRAGMTAVVITYRPRSAVRNVGKALGLSLDRVDRLAKRIEHFREEPNLAQRCREAGIDPETTTGRQLVDLVGQLIGFPRHLSQHTGGMVMTQRRLCELVPIENAAMDDRTVIQWNKDDLDELGILKVDCLALGMLTAIHKCFDLIEKHYGRRFTLATIPPDDRDVYAMICRADTMGVFQIESRAQMSMLPRLRPRCFYDLVIEVAIVRPGPIQGNMVHPYLRRRNGEEPVTYPNDAIRKVLEKTLGVPLFQEQAMRLAVVAAGFTPGEADQLRRAMGAWRRPGIIDQFRKKLIDGMQAKGMPPEYAEATFRQIRGFGDYGFPESHAASFALLVYVTSWLKCHYQAAFTTALLNSQPMGFYAPAQLVRNAREHGVEVLPPDVNHSQWESTLEEGSEEGSGFGVQGSEFQGNGSLEGSGASDQDLLFFENFPPQDGGRRTGEDGRRKDQIDCCPEVLNPEPRTLNPSPRLGLHMLQGMSQAHAECILQARTRLGVFHSVDEFTQRTGLSRAVVTRLSKAGVFRSLGLNRREALWHALAQDQKKLPLFEACNRTDREEEAHREQSKQGMEKTYLSTSTEEVDLTRTERIEDTERSKVDLPKMSPAEEVLADYRTTGLSLSAHPMEFLREYLDRQGVVPAEKLTVLPNGGPVRVAGIVLVRQRPGTAKGITFVTLEDETGQANLIVRPDVWKRWRAAALGATILQANGRLQRNGLIIHVLTAKLINLTDQLKRLVTRSRNFC